VIGFGLDCQSHICDGFGLDCQSKKIGLSNSLLTTIIRSCGREKIFQKQFRESVKKILLARFVTRSVTEEVRLSNVPPDPGAVHSQQPGDRRRHHGGGGRDVHE